MFGGGMPDLQQMIQQAQRLQEQLGRAQQELASTSVTGTAGGGAVTATVTGSGELLSLTISPAALAGDPVEAAETISDLVLAAVRNANVNAAELQHRTMGPLTEGIGGLGGGLDVIPGDIADIAGIPGVPGSPTSGTPGTPGGSGGQATIPGPPSSPDA